MKTFNEKNIFYKNRVSNMPKLITVIDTDTTILDIELSFEAAIAIKNKKTGNSMNCRFRCRGSRI